MQYVLLITSKYKPTLIQIRIQKQMGGTGLGISQSGVSQRGVSQRGIYHFTSSHLLSELPLSFCRFKFFIFIILLVYFQNIVLFS